MSKYTLFLVMLIVCLALSIYYEDTTKEVGYVVLMCFFVSIYSISKIYDRVMLIDKALTAIKEKLDNE